MQSQITGRMILVEGKEYLYLAGTSYLNLPYEQTFQEALREGIRRFGSSYGSSPLSNPRLLVFEELERYLAEAYQFESALLFPNGFQAGQCCINELEKTYSFRGDSLIHPAIQSKAINNFQQLVFNSDTIDPINLSQYSTPNEFSNNDLFLLDASHSIGILDEHISQVPHKQQSIITCSLNKAYGINAGILLLSNEQKEKMKMNPFYMSSSCPSPAEVFALLHCLKTGFIKEQKEKLMAILPKSLNANFTSSNNFPVLLLEDQSNDLFEFFKRNDIFIWRNNYGQKDNSKRNRIVFHAGHTKEDVERSIDLLNRGK